ncbi:D-inositol-3-phosphate glycosyltransferase [uncultured archaeon]|nr:D-inositol-3-phosphate glycosyltransferase [uncultured archaeon]
MRVGIFSRESLYSIKIGGIAPHVSELSEALAKRIHEVHIFTCRGDFDAYDIINGVHYHRVDFDKSGSLIEQMDRMSSAMYERFLKAQKIFGKFDIVHGHDWHPIPAMNLVKKNLSIPYILTLHSTEWGRSGNKSGNSEISHREWLGGYESSRLIVTTRCMQEELKSIYSIPESKISIIPNGIISGKVRKALGPGQIKERYGIHPLAPVVLFCGRMSYQKGPDLLVEAVPRVLKKRQDARFIFVGEGDMRSYCERRARELGIADACRFLGYVSSAEKQELMNACDLVCIPSRNEPFGVVVLEAWDACKPVVATEAVSIINNFEDGLLAYVQPESIAWCINRLLDNPDEMKKLAYKGCNRIDAEFSWDSIALKTEKVYNKALRRYNTSKSKLTSELK